MIIKLCDKLNFLNITEPKIKKALLKWKLIFLNQLVFTPIKKVITPGIEAYLNRATVQVIMNKKVVKSKSCNKKSVFTSWKFSGLLDFISSPQTIPLPSKQISIIDFFKSVFLTFH